MTTDEIKTALAPYGATLNEAGFITRNGKDLSVRPVVSGKRIRFESADGLLLASCRACTDGVVHFVTKFWFWKPV